MATNAITALGTVVTFNSNTYGELTTISGNRTRNVIDVLSVDSTDGFVEKIGGALNEGEVTMHIIYDGSAAGVYDDMNTDWQAGTADTVLITYSDTSSFSAPAVISSLGTPGFGAPDGICEIDITFALTGKATFTDVAA